MAQRQHNYMFTSILIPYPYVFSGLKAAQIYVYIPSGPSHYICVAKRPHKYIYIYIPIGSPYICVALMAHKYVCLQPYWALPLYLCGLNAVKYIYSVSVN